MTRRARTMRWVVGGAALAAAIGCAPTGDSASSRLESGAEALTGRATDAPLEVTALGQDGRPVFVRGAISRVHLPLDDRSAAAALAGALERLAPFFGTPASQLEVLSVRTDELSHVHVRFAQRRLGLAVDGGELVLHVSPEGLVYAASGTTRDDARVGATPRWSAAEAQESARRLDGCRGLSLSEPVLTFLISASDLSLHLAYKMEAEGLRDQMPVRDTVFLDAQTGEWVETQPHVLTAKAREIHNAAHKTSLPGAVILSEGGTSSDTDATANYQHLGIVYDCYKTVFNRDSIDGQGMKMVSSVHFGNGLSNAFWNGSQMVYGDGNGTTEKSFAQSFDVTGHELTHGVTERSANMIYQAEPGALNEATSDVLSTSCYAWSKSWTIDGSTWLLGDDIYKSPGQATRFMDDPSKDGMSPDFYPELYRGNLDNGGVHINSGIPNLAFKLMVTGGKHPHNKTSTQVPAIGFEKSARIWYRALTTNFGTKTNFSGARAGASQAAKDLFDSTTARAVEMAFAAVGVGTEPAGTCASDGACVQGCATPDPDCACIQNGQCDPACRDLTTDPDCPKDCVKNGVCAVEACPVPDSDCVELGEACSGESVCRYRKCMNDPQHPDNYCSKGCTSGDDCTQGMTCSPQGVCQKPQEPETPAGGNCVPNRSLCAPGTACGLLVGETQARCLAKCTTENECTTHETCADGADGLRYCRPRSTSTHRGWPNAAGNEPTDPNLVTGGCSAVGPTGVSPLVALGLLRLLRGRSRRR